MSYKHLTYEEIRAIADKLEGSVSEALAKQIIVACTLDLASNLPENADAATKKAVRDLLAITGVSPDKIHKEETPYLVVLAQRNPEVARLIEPTLKAVFQ